MAEVLLFVTGVLAGFIAGYFISRRSRASSAPNGSTERLLEGTQQSLRTNQPRSLAACIAQLDKLVGLSVQPQQRP